MVKRAPTALEEKLGWTFNDPARLREALTHSTYVNENVDSGPSYERLEFLGDAVLNLLSAHQLFELVNDPEGELTRRRARVVRQEALAELAQNLGLSDHLRLGQSHTTRANPSVLADSYEALVGAVFLDGGYGAVQECFGAALAAAIERASEPVDFKSMVQETCHQLGLAPPEYRVVKTQGPDHARRYTCEIVVDSDVMGLATSSSKKAAEQACARLAIAELRQA